MGTLPPTNQDPKAVEAAIRARRTFKVLGAADSAVSLSAEAAERNRSIVLDSLRIAGWAPFHHDRGADGLAEPWRAHVLWHRECQELVPRLFEWFPAMERSSKIPKMMYACGALVLVTWIPESISAEKRTQKHDDRDHDHMFASGAMVQNLLLMLTSHGMGTYWSSGGDLGSDFFFSIVGIPSDQRLVAAVFVEYPETQGEEKTRKPGANRDKRTDGWIREVPSSSY